MTVLVGAVATPSASALDCEFVNINSSQNSGPVGISNPCRELDPVLDAPFVVIGLAFFVVGVVLDTYDQSDLDGDGVPDEVERQICSRDTVADGINSLEQSVRCDKDADDLIVPTPGLVQFVEERVLQPANEAANETREDAEDAQRMAEENATVLHALVVGIVNGAIDLVDRDRDGVPDALEPSLCGLEGSGPEDGHCNPEDTDYTPPVSP